MEDLVSIIIPVFNRAALIDQTLNSISLQSYKNWECIVVDDGSTDNSVKIVQEFATKDDRFKCFKRPADRKKGANACRNYGFENSSGSFINWFDSDDIMHVDFIKLKVEAHLNFEVDAIISKTAMFREDPSEITGYENRTALTDNSLEDFLKLKISWYLQDVMWRRSYFKEKDLFDEALLAGQDRDFHARMLMKDPILKIIDHNLTYYRVHDQNITSKIDDMRNVDLKISHLKSVVNLVSKLDTAGKLSNGIKVFYFYSMIKYLPFVITNKSDFYTLKNLLQKLTFPNIKIIIGWIKFYTAYVSFKIFGKGTQFLK